MKEEILSPVNIRNALSRYVFGAAMYSVAIALYLFLPFYKDFLIPQTRAFLLVLYAGYIAIAPLYYAIRRSSSEKSQGQIILEAFVRLFRRLAVSLNQEQESDSALSPKEKAAVLFFLVKLFFIPVMLNFLFQNFGGLSSSVKELLSSGFSAVDGLRFVSDNFYRAALAGIFFLDTLYFSFGYLVEAKGLKNTVKSVEPTLLGWTVALICYPPFNGWLSSYVPWFPSDYVRFGGVGETLVARGVIVALLAVYLWATLSLGFKCSNLTNRGIVSGGAYRFVRHPAYASKVLSWWIMTLPALSMVSIASMGAWTFIYYLRALTEERHLSRDPDYIAYRKDVRWRFIPGIL